MGAQITKIILIIFLAFAILGNLFLYRIKKYEKYHSYFYMNATISIMCTFIFLCLDTNLFTVTYDEWFYLINLFCYIGAILLATFIMFIIKYFIGRNKKPHEQDISHEV